MSAVVAVWRIKNGRPVGRLHLRSEFWTNLRRDRAVVTQCGQAFEDVRGEKHENLTVQWSCDPKQWPDLPRCGHCVKSSPFIRQALLREIETLDTFTQQGERPWLSTSGARASASKSGSATRISVARAIGSLCSVARQRPSLALTAGCD